MFHLYTILKAHPAGEIVTQEEMDVAAGHNIFDSVQTASYLKKLGNHSWPRTRAREQLASVLLQKWQDENRFRVTYY